MSQERLFFRSSRGKGGKGGKGAQSEGDKSRARSGSRGRFFSSGFQLIRENIDIQPIRAISRKNAKAARGPQDSPGCGRERGKKGASNADR